MFTPEELEQLRRLVVEAVREAFTGGTTIAPPPTDIVTMREDGASQSTKLLDYKRSYEMSADPRKKEFAKWIPEWFFVERPDLEGKLTERQLINIHKNTNQARLDGGFAGFSDFVGMSGNYVKSFWTGVYKESPINDACSLPGNNGPGVPAVTLADVPALFDRLFERYKLSGMVPGWKMAELVYPS